MQKRFTLKDVAIKAKTSIRTASRVINDSNLVNPKTKEKVLNVIKELNYSPNIIARSLKSKSSKTIGVIILDIYSPFFSALIRGIESIATQHDYSVIICESQYDVRLENKHLKTLIDRMVDGIIINPASRTYNNIKNIADQGVKIVILGHPEFFNINISSVYFDEYEGMRIAIQHLVDNGHKKILFINGDIECISKNLRLKGYKDAIEKNNIPFKDELIFKGKVDIEGGYNISDGIFKSGLDFSAIMCFNDLIAMGILKYCHENNINIPKDYSLMGFDDIFCTSLLNPPLTTVHQPKNYLGKIVGELLINKLNDINIDNQHIKIPPTLVIRESVKKIN